MARTMIFVSYGREDGRWLRMFQQHIALLERLGVVDLWDDTRIASGAEWEREIDVALTNAKVAVLLISPAFLSSQFIWEREMPRIEAHCREGMEVLPLIVRSCPWRLSEFLAKFMARPDKALSLMNEGEIDFALMNFTYELAAKVEKFPTAASLGSNVASSKAAPSKQETSDDLRGRWDGSYNSTRQIRLVIDGGNVGAFRGKMEYPEEGIVTLVEGAVDRKWSPHDPVWRQINRGGSGLAVTFQEVDYKRRGSGAGISFDGKYYGYVIGNEMYGAWFEGTRLVGLFNLERKVN
jgi:hypothetical protein